MSSYISYPPKDPDEELNASLNFAGRLDPGETITAAVVTVQVIGGTDPNPSAMLYGPVDITQAPNVIQKLVGGVLGAEYKIKFRVTTTTQKRIGTRLLKVVDGGAP